MFCLAIGITMKFLKIILFTLSIFFFKHSRSMERPMPGLVPWYDEIKEVQQNNSVSPNIIKKQKTKKSRFFDLFESPVKRLDTLCIEAVSKELKKYVEEFGYSQCLTTVKQIIKSMKYTPKLQELLLNYLDKDTQPIWKQIAQINGHLESCIYNGNLIAWLDKYHILYANTKIPGLIYKKRFDTKRSKSLRELAISPNQNWLAIIASDNITHKDELNFFNIIHDAITTIPTNELITSFTFSPDGTAIVGTQQGNLMFFNTNEKNEYTLKNSYQAHTSPITQLLVASNGKYFISVDAEKNIKLWNTKDKNNHIPILLPKELSIGHSIFISCNSQYIAIKLNIDYYDFVSDEQVMQDVLIVNTTTGKIKKIILNETDIIRFIDSNGNIIIDSRIDDSNQDGPIRLKFLKVSHDTQEYKYSKIFNVPAGYIFENNTQNNPNFVSCLTLVEGFGKSCSSRIFSSEQLSLKQLLFKIAACSPSQSKLNNLLQDPLLRTFKRKHCSNLMKNFIETKLEQLEKEN